MSTAATFLLPGWGLGKDALSTLAQHLSARSIDLPGYGGTDPEPRFDQAVERIASELPLGTNLVGWSLGGLLAMAIATRHPEKVAKLVLIASSPCFITQSDWPYGLAQAVLDGFIEQVQQAPESTINQFVRGFNRGDVHSKAIYRELMANAEKDVSFTTLVDGLVWLRDINLRTELSEIQAPTLILHGDADPLMPIEGANALAKLIPNAKLVSFEQVAHAPFLSCPEALLLQVQTFLQSSPNAY